MGSLEDALQLVHLYFERGSPMAEPAARRWLVRYLSEGTRSLWDVARVAASLAERELHAGGLHGASLGRGEAAEDDLGFAIRRRGTPVAWPTDG